MAAIIHQECQAERIYRNVGHTQGECLDWLMTPQGPTPCRQTMHCPEQHAAGVVFGMTCGL